MMMPSLPKFGALPWQPSDRRQFRQAVQENRVALVDIDTQYDFMMPEGKLYVPGAESLLGNLKKLVRLGKDHKLPVVATLDAHELPRDQAHMDLFKEISDGHCIKGTEGQKKVPETVIEGQTPLVISEVPGRAKAPTPEEIKRQFAQGNPIYVEKSDNSAFTANPVGEQFFSNLKKAGIDTVAVFGVATDFCVKAAVEGFKKLGFNTVVVSDAVESIDNQNLDAPFYDDIKVATTTQVSQAVREGKQS